MRDHPWWYRAKPYGVILSDLLMVARGRDATRQMAPTDTRLLQISLLFRGVFYRGGLPYHGWLELNRVSTSAEIATEVSKDVKRRTAYFVARYCMYGDVSTKSSVSKQSCGCKVIWEREMKKVEPVIQDGTIAASDSDCGDCAMVGFVVGYLSEERKFLEGIKRPSVSNFYTNLDKLTWNQVESWSHKLVRFLQLLDRDDEATVAATAKLTNVTEATKSIGHEVDLEVVADPS